MVARADFQAKNIDNPPSSGKAFGSLQSSVGESEVTALMSLLVSQISSANQALDLLVQDSSVEAPNFKALASASQNVLENIGEEAVLASIENGGGSSTPIGDGSNEFTLEVLSELSLQAQINVYAPILNENALSRTFGFK